MAAIARPCGASSWLGDADVHVVCRVPRMPITCLSDVATGCWSEVSASVASNGDTERRKSGCGELTFCT